MLMRLFKWIFRHFAPYVAGILVGVGFFFLLVDMLPRLSALSALDWPALESPVIPAKKVVSVPVPAQQERSVPSSPSTASPNGGQAVTEPAKISTAIQQAPPFVEAESGSPNRRTTLPEVLPPEQPLEAELERDPVEMAAPRLAPTKPTVANPAREVAKPLSCGVPPTRPGYSMDQYLACQWRADCLSRLDRSRRMIEQDKRRCPTVGSDAQACLAYYRALEQQYHPSLCSGWPTVQMPGWR